MSTATGSVGQTQQFLTFRLGEEEYGVDILSIQEIRGYSTITPLPNLPHYVRGVINLRGVVVPVVDLRLRFDMPQVPPTKFSVVVVVVVKGRVAGFVVDSVSDVVDFQESEIQAAPDLGGNQADGMVRGLAKAGERLVVLLDPARVLALDLELAA